MPVLDVAFCDSSDCALVLFVSVSCQICPKEIAPIHVSSFQGVGSAVFLASSTGMLHKMKVTLNASKDGRNSSAVSEEEAGHRPHPSHRNEDGLAASAKLSCVSSLSRIGSECFIADGGRLRLHTPTQEFRNWMPGNPPQRKMKSPECFRERRPPAWESIVLLQRKPWRIQGYP